MSQKRVWVAVDVSVDPVAVEAVESAFNVLGALGTEVDSLRKAKAAEQTVTGFFDQTPTRDEIDKAIADSVQIYELLPSTIHGITAREVEETDWLAEWKKHWKPTEIAQFVIAPPWEDVPLSDKIVIRIEPNMAFGTGTHETTQLCLKAIGEHYRPEQTLLDVGTGTGILAIAAAKLGGRTILACDTDADSIKIARENAVLNETDWIEFADGPLASDAPIYDFVCANLTIDVIVPILDLLLAKTGSVLLLSGILVEQKGMISDALEEPQISDFKFEISGEWLSVLVKK